MATVYRGKFLQEFLRFAKQAELPITPQLRKTLYSKNWVVYAKRPFQNPAAVVEYLGRYTHRVAISNHRIKSTDNGKVSFSYKDYAHGAITKIMTLHASEFLRRFCLHILPPMFVKIRHYGFLSRRNKEELRAFQQEQGINSTGVQKEKHGDPLYFQEECNITICPCCHKGTLITILYFAANAPPPTINNKLKTHAKT
ncbi:transposase [Mongoliitalea lutea]|uniref:IS91 family transposase n=1 Tax=Mongoliitalea lutea TaxID=849756 RepID=UPI001E2BFE72|nr:transposase [Mongoliitalea lutea]